MAAYGAQLEQGKSEQRGARSTSRQLFDNVPVQDKSAREALQTFVGGKGDVLLAYENEAITAQQKGEDVDYVVPGRDDPDPEPDRGHDRAADADRRKAFVDFARSEEAQKIFAEKGYRSVIAEPGRRVEVPDAAEPVRDRRSSAAGRKVNDEFFDPEKGVVAEIEQDLGVSTEK